MFMKQLFDGFPVIIEGDAEEWTAYLAELPNVSASGDHISGALFQLTIAWDAMKQSYIKHDEPMPQSQFKRGLC